MQRNHSRAAFPLTILLFFFLITGLAADAGATAIYSAWASQSISISGIADSSGQLSASPTDLDIQFGVPFGVPPILFGEPPTYKDEYTDSEGDASATASASATTVADDPSAGLDIGDGFDLLAEASGEASSPPFSWAESEATAEGFLYLFNQSDSETYTITFTIDWAYSVYASADDPDPFYEWANASITLYADDFYGTPFEIYEYADSAEALSNFSGSGSDTFSITLASGEDNGLNFGVWANDVFIFFNEGFAGSDVPAVPEPASLILLGTGLLGLAGFRRRRKK